MSFYDNVAKIAGEVFGNVHPQDLAQAAGDHINQMDPNDLAGHLKQSVGTMDQASLMALGQHLLQQCMGGSSADAAQVAQDAGTTHQAVASGAPAAISALIEYCKSNPDTLKAATTALINRNPDALRQMAPGLLSGIMARISGKDQPQQ